MKVSAVIPVYNEEKYIEKCLIALFNQKEKADEIIVVDNNCTDKTIDIAKKFNIKIIHETEQGMIPARNRGFDEARYEIIARTDADTRVPATWVKQIKENFRNPDIIALSGPEYFYDIPRGIRISYWSSLIYFKLIKKGIKTDVLLGPNMAIRKNIWEKVKNDICLEDALVHEDIDLAIHSAQYGKIKLDRKLMVATSGRRWKKPYSYLEYSQRLAKMLRKHNFRLR